MNKVELIKNVAKETGFTQKDVREVLEAVQDVTFNALRDQDEVKILDGVTLCSVHRGEREGRNPLTGETITISARYTPKCKFGKVIKEVINAD